MMVTTLTSMFGVVFGLIGGAVAGHMLKDLGSGGLERIIGGALAGAFAGLVGGTVGADLGAKGDKGPSRTVVGLVAGACGGAIGAMQSEFFFDKILSLGFKLVR